MARVTFEGRKLDSRTRDMFLAARSNSRLPLEISQGSYNTSVGASAGTHAGGGAIDIKCSNLTDAQERLAVWHLRRVGFAAWLRTENQGDWPRHIHAIAIGCSDLSSGARSQVAAYKRGRNGLANNGRDDATRAFVNVTWEKYLTSVKAPTLAKPSGMPRHPLYVNTVQKAIDIERGTRRDKLDAWEAAHVNKVKASMTSQLRRKGVKPHQSIMNVTKQYQTAFKPRGYRYGSFDAATAKLLCQQSGYVLYSGPRHVYGTK